MTSTRRKDSTTKEGKDSEKCGSCLKLVSEKEKGVQCELCEDWFHTSCVNISDELYRCFSKNDGLHWFCVKCNGNFLRVFNSVSRLEARIEKVEERQNTTEVSLNSANEKSVKMETEFEKMEKLVSEINVEFKVEKNRVGHELNKLREEVDKELSRMSKELDTDKLKVIVKKQVKEELEQTVHKEMDVTIDKKVSESTVSFRDIMKMELEQEMKRNVDQMVKKELDDVTDEIEDVQRSLQETRNFAAEEKDKENRRNNIILYRVPESESAEASDRAKDDSRFCFQLLNSLNVGAVEEDVIKVIRLGRRSSDSDNNRPVLVQLASRGTKNLVMESLYKLKQGDAKFRTIIVSHDMTVKEREDCRRLVNEAKHRNSQESSGEWIHLVRGLPGQMKILKMRKRQ